MRTILIASIVILFLAALPLEAGPLKNFHNPYIPPELLFGDSPESVVEQMGREPLNAELERLENGYAVHVYEQGPIPGLEDEKSIWILTYVFQRDSLAWICCDMARTADDAAEAEKKVQEMGLTVWAFLSEKYGDPTLVQKAPWPDGAGVYTFPVWEFEDGALVWFPKFLATNEQSAEYGSTILLAPLNPEHNYGYLFQPKF